MDDDLTNEFVSVIMPVYNSGKFLSEAIGSILNQSHTQFELIIINDGSVDDTEKVISNFADDRIKYIYNDKNKGIVYSLNKAVELSKGKYIARMDGDDIAFTDRLQLQLQEFNRNPQLIVCGGWYQTLYKKKVLNTVKLPVSNDHIKAALLFENPICHPAVMFKRLVWENAGGYVADEVNCEDYGLWCRAVNMGDFLNIPAPLIRYRLHGSNISSSKIKERLGAEENIKANVISAQIGHELELSLLFKSSDNNKILFLANQLSKHIRLKTTGYQQKAQSGLFHFIIAKTGLLATLTHFKGYTPLFLLNEMKWYFKEKLNNQKIHFRRYLIDRFSNE